MQRKSEIVNSRLVNIFILSLFLEKVKIQRCFRRLMLDPSLTISLCLYCIFSIFFTILDFISLSSKWFVLIFPLASHSHFFKCFTEYFFQLSLKQHHSAAILPSCYSQNSSSHCCVPSLPSYLKILSELLFLLSVSHGSLM